MQILSKLVSTVKRDQSNIQAVQQCIKRAIQTQNEQILIILDQYPQILNKIRLRDDKNVNFFLKKVFPHIRKPCADQLKIICRTDQSNPLLKICKAINFFYNDVPQQNFQDLLFQLLNGIISNPVIKANKWDIRLKQLILNCSKIAKSLDNQKYKIQSGILSSIVVDVKALRKQEKYIFYNFLWRIGENSFKNKIYYEDLLKISVQNPQFLLFAYESKQLAGKLQIILQQVLDKSVRKRVLKLLYQLKRCKWGIKQNIGLQISDLPQIRTQNKIQVNKINEFLIENLKGPYAQSLPKQQLLKLEFLEPSQLIGYMEQVYRQQDHLKHMQEPNLSINLLFVDSIKNNNLKEYFQECLGYIQSSLTNSSYPSYQNICNSFIWLTNCLFIAQKYTNFKHFNTDHSKIIRQAVEKSCIQQLLLKDYFRIAQSNTLKEFNLLIFSNYFFKYGCYERVKLLYSKVGHQQKQQLLQIINSHLNSQVNKQNHSQNIQSSFNGSLLMFLQLTNSNPCENIRNQIFNKLVSQEIELQSSCVIEFLCLLQKIPKQIVDILIQSLLHNQGTINLKLSVLIKHSPQKIKALSDQLWLIAPKIQSNNLRKLIEMDPNLIFLSDQLDKKQFKKKISSMYYNMVNPIELIFDRLKKQTIRFFKFESLSLNDQPVIYSWIHNQPTDQDYYKNHWRQNIWLEYVECYLMSIKAQPQKCQEALQSALQLYQFIAFKMTQPLQNSSQFFDYIIYLKFIYSVTRHQILSSQTIKTELHQKLFESSLQLIKKDSHPVSRQYIQCVLCRAYILSRQRNHTALVSSIDNIISHTIPIILTLGYELLHFKKQQNLIELVKFFGTHLAYLRGISQYYVKEYTSKYNKSHDKFLIEMTSFWEKDKDSTKIMKNIQIVVEGFKEAVEKRINFLGFQRVEDFPSLKVQRMYHTDALQLLGSLSLDQLDSQLAIQTVNRKTQLLEMIKQPLSDISVIKLPTVIIIASLLQKVHNFGHLIRTLNSHNAMLVVNSKQPLLHPQCTQLIPENHDVQIIEVKQSQLEQFIQLQKKLSYPVIALEQCSTSVNLQGFNFPQKFVMILGNQRIGAPAKLLKMADYLVQIPQVGKIRSLNVHVSMVICFWQYLKQLSQ